MTGLPSSKAADRGSAWVSVMVAMSFVFGGLVGLAILACTTALGSLPESQRQAVRLLKLRELSLKEAAAASGMSVGALKVTMHRALASLRRSLKGKP